MIEGRKAISLDFDGVLFPRPTQVQWGGLKSRVIKPWSYDEPFIPKHAPITVDQRVPVNHPLSIFEKVNFIIHSKRRVRPEMAEFVKNTKAEAIFGNTGRPNHVLMVRMTRARLRQTRINKYIDDIFFKPEGVSSDESKYWALRQLLEMGFADITHYDDNALTVKRLAGALPQVRFVIVQDLTSGILFSRREMEKYSNVTRIAIHKKQR